MIARVKVRTLFVFSFEQLLLFYSWIYFFAVLTCIHTEYLHSHLLKKTRARRRRDGVDDDGRRTGR